MKILASKLQKTILYDTKRDAQLKPCVAPSVATFQHCPRMIQIIILPKQHSVAGPSKTYKCKLCHAEFPGFYVLRQHKNTQHGRQIGFGASNIHVQTMVGDVDDQSLREELQSCRYFLVDSEKQKGDIVCSFLLSTTLHLKLSKKNRTAFWIN